MQLDKETHEINTKLPVLEKSISRVTVNSNDRNTGSHTSTRCDTASHTETNTEINTLALPSPACETSTISRTVMAPSEVKPVLISGFIKKDACNLKLAAFSAIHAILGSFSLADIVSC